jgi:dTDP-4-dehydrorhamnose 3,5-epimerase
MGDMREPFVVPLKRIPNEKGDILHAMKRSERGFRGFGEAYFTTVRHGVTKGWKRHRKMTLNLVVPVGAVRFVVHDDRTGEFHDFRLSEDNYGRLNVPPGLWVAFRGLDEGLNLILNIADLEHDPAEAESVELEKIEYEW